MKRAFFFTTLTVLVSIISHIGNCQNADPLMLQIGDEKITRNEFVKIYEKNSIKGEKPDNKAIEEYLDLFINFRLKVAEAKSLGMDTIKSFREELGGYRKQLAQPYLVDKDANDKMIREAYERKQFDVRASHILVRVERLAAAADTLAAWNKIMQLHKRILKGEDFGKVAAEASEDPSAKDRTIEGQTVKGNRGDLGYFTVFDMVYPFESVVYNAKVNEVSYPVRTDFGYHLVKVTQKIPALGSFQLAHIIMVYPPKATLDDSLKVADSANMAYKFLKAGSDFGEIASKYSDDKATASKGGVLPWFGVNRLLPEFVSNLMLLKKGEYSEPFQTLYGWHIIKLVDKKSIPSFEEDNEELKQRVTKSDRNTEVLNSFLTKTCSKYGFTQNNAALQELTKTVTDSIFTATWKIEQAAGLNKDLFAIGLKQYTQTDFAKYLVSTQRVGPKNDIPAFVNEQYKVYTNDEIYKYADSQLEVEKPDFKALINEYHDGILLFDLTDKKVWSKAVKDSAGLQQFYEKNKNTYLWDERLDASIMIIKDKSILKSLQKMLKKGTTDEKIRAKFNRDTIQKITIERKKYLKNENMNLETVEWKPGISDVIPLADNECAIVVVHKIAPPEPKQLNEVRGAMTADYQSYLEKEWISDLRAKYPVQVNREVFETILNQK